MRATGIFLALLLRASAVFAQSQCQTCTCDGCLATLDPSAHYAISQTADASASAACFSWPGMSTTTYLGPTTTTVTVTRNITVDTTTSTTTTAPSTQTVFGTVTSTYTSTDVVQTTQNPTTTVQTTSISFVYSYIGTKSFYKRQAVSDPALPDNPSSYVAPVPSAYSPYCSGDVAFLSACQCIGVTQTTFTSSGLTATATVTVNQTVVGSTEVDTSTVYSPVIVSQTSTARSTVVATSSSIAVSTVTTYSVSDVVATTTVSTSVATAAAPTGYLRVADSGSPYDGYYLTNVASPNFNGSLLEMNLTDYGPYATQFSLVPTDNGTSNLVGIDQINGSTYMVAHDREYADQGSGWTIQNDFHQLYYVPVEGFDVELWDYVGCEDDDSPTGPLLCHSYPGDPSANPDNLYSGTIFQMCPPANWNASGLVFGDLILTDVPAPNCTTISLEWIEDPITAGSPLYKGELYRMDPDPSSYEYSQTGYFWSPPIQNDRWSRWSNKTLYIGTDWGSTALVWYENPHNNLANDGCHLNYIAPGEVYAAATNATNAPVVGPSFAAALEDFPGNFTSVYCASPADVQFQPDYWTQSVAFPRMLWIPIAGLYYMFFGPDPFEAWVNTTFTDGSAELFDNSWGNFVQHTPWYGSTHWWQPDNCTAAACNPQVINQLVNATYWSDGHVELLAGYSVYDDYIHLKNVPRVCYALYGDDWMENDDPNFGTEYPFLTTVLGDPAGPKEGYGARGWGNGSIYAWDVGDLQMWASYLYPETPLGVFILDTNQTEINHPELECVQTKLYWTRELPTEAEIAAAAAAEYQVLTPS